MQSILYFLTGFGWNLISMAISCVPMSLDVGWICVNKKDYFWNIDELELVQALDNNDQGEGK